MKINNRYFEYVVKNCNLLIFGEKYLDDNSDILKHFKSITYQELTPYTLEKLSATINEFNIDAIIITAKQNKKQIYNTLYKIKQTRSIYLMLCFNYQDEDFCEDLVNICDTVFTKNISYENLKYKIYNSINDNIAATHIAKDINNNEQRKKQRYIDTFDTEVMFISDELKDISFCIDNGDISKEMFIRLEQSITKVSHIVNTHLISSKTIQELINKLHIYLQNFDIHSIDISCIDGFEHLSRLIEDIAVFLDKYFISKQMNDIYVVEDSLINSFEYVKLVFEGKENSDDDESEVEFF
jgi:hypothetical protein